MRGERIATWLLVCGLGCSGPASKPPLISNGTGSGNGGGSSDDGGAPGDDGSSGAAGEFTASGTMSDVTNGAPLGSVAICLLSAPTTCTSTDGSGAFSIAVPASGSGIRGVLAGYVAGVWPMTSTANVGWSLDLRTSTLLETYAAQLGTTFGAGDGAIIFRAYDAGGTPMSGVSVAVSAGGKVGYFKGNGSGLDSTLTATTTSGNGYVFGVPAGDIGVLFTASGLTCSRAGAEAWPGSNGSTMIVPIMAGELTRASAKCQ